LIFSSGSAGNDGINVDTNTLTLVGTGSDSWLFISGSTGTTDKIVLGGNSVVSGAVYFSELSSAPSAETGKGLIYVGTDKSLYYIDSDGTSNDITAGGGGGGGSFFTSLVNAEIFTTGSLVASGSISVKNVSGTANVSLATNGTVSGSGNFNIGGNITIAGDINADRNSPRNVLTDVSSITIGGAASTITIPGDLAVNGGDITTTSGIGSIFDTNATTVNIAGAATTATNIGNASGLTTIAGDLQVSGNDIKSSGGSPAITMSGADVEIVGDLTVTGNDIKSSGGTTAVTLSGADVTIAGDLQVGGNDIKSSGGSTAISLSGADVTIAGDLTISGNDIKTSSGVPLISFSGTEVIIPGDLTVNGTTTTINTTNLEAKDTLIGLGFTSGSVAVAPGDRGFIGGISGGNSVAFVWSNANSAFAATETSSGISGGTVNLDNLKPIMASAFRVGGANSYISSSDASNLQVIAATTAKISGSGGVTVGSDSDVAFAYKDATHFTVASNSSNDSRLYSSNILEISSSASRVLILSGGSGASQNPRSLADINFYVSGSTNSAGTLTRGTALFAGDLAVSGTIKSSGTIVHTAAANGIGTIYAATNVATITIGSYATTTNIASLTNTNSTIGIGTGATISGQTKSLNLGTGGNSNSITNIALGSSTAGALGTVWIRQPTVIVTGSLQITGSVYAQKITGSLTKLVDGSDYLRAGSNITLTTGSDGSITIASAGGGGGSSAYFTDPTSGNLNTTGSLALAGGLGASYTTSNAGSDVFFFTSGSKGTIASRSSSGISLFGGDIVTSGSITLDNGAGYGIMHMTAGGELSLRNRSLGGAYVGSVFTSLGSAVNFMEVRPNGYATGSAVSIMPGLYAGPANPFNSHDTTFFVSGKRNAKGGNERGASVFGGDIVASGSAYFGTDTSDSIVVNSRLASDIIPDGNRTRNLGSDSARFANIYTGDLHLRNERGDYTLIEEEDCLTVRFNKNGKRYRFVLERAPEFDEVSD
jgi:hypothetical protein